MKKIQKMCFLALIGLMVGTSCEKTSQTPPAPTTQTDCIEGVVIAFARDTNNPDPELRYTCRTLVDIKNRNIGKKFGNYNNCLAIRNLSRNLFKLNQKVYFDDYVTDDCGGVQGDCFGPISCITAINLSTECKK